MNHLNIIRYSILQSFTIALLMAVSIQSEAAGIWFEPYGGIETGNVEQGNSANDFSGQNLGLRLGGLRSSFIFGFEYALGDFNVDDVDDDLKTKDLGAFLGYVADPIRLWITYWFDSEAEYGGTYTGNSGYKIGLGLKVFSMVSINIEKCLRIYDEVNGQSFNPKYEVDGMLISASLPFSF